MAVFQWIARVEREGLEERLLGSIAGMGLELDLEISNDKIIYARDPDRLKCGISERVNIVITLNNSTQGEYLVEVRSSEPMLMKDTRCERVAQKVKQVIPPQS